MFSRICDKSLQQKPSVLGGMLLTHASIPHQGGIQHCPSKAHAVTVQTQSSQTLKTATQWPVLFRPVNALLGTQLMLLFANMVESSCLAAGMCKLLKQPVLQRQNFALAPLLSAWGEMVCAWVRECRGLPAIKHIRIRLSLERAVEELLLPFDSSS